MIGRASFKTQTFNYDFAVDGGAVSNINSGVFIPANCYILNGFLKVTTTLTSAGAATVGVGFVGTAGTLIVPTPVGAFVQNVVIALNTNFFTAGLQIQTNIAGAALTAGFFTCTIYYNEYQN